MRDKTSSRAECVLRLAGAFLTAQVAGYLLLILMQSAGISSPLYSLIKNTICVAAVNAAAHFIFCGGISLPKRAEDYSRAEPVAIFFAAVLLSCLAAWITTLFIGGNKIMPYTPVSDTEFLLSAVYTVIISPIAEELAFRGAALSMSARHGGVFALITTSLFFALYHLDISQMPYTFVLGCMLSLLALRSGSVLPCIPVHMGNNLLTVLMSRFDISAVVDIVIPVLGAAAVIWIIAAKKFKLPRDNK